jgi:hypothetical protein
VLPADAGYSVAVTETHTAFRQAFVLDAAGDVLEELPVDPSSGFQVGGSLVRRSGTLVIPNRDGRYTPSRGGLIDFGRIYLVRYGVRLSDGATLFCDQPWLFPDSDEIDVGGRVVSVPLSDGMRIVSASAQLAQPLSFPDGTPLEDAVRTLLTACGAAGAFDLDAGGAHFVGDAGYETGTFYADILNQWQVDYALDLWAAPPCVYTLRPIPDPAVTPPVATWRLGSQVRLLGLRVTRQSLARNHAIVDGIDPYGSPFTVEAFDDNPASPVRFGTTGVGDLSTRWKSDGITTPEQAAMVARSLLVTYGVQRTFDAVLPVDASLDRRDTVRIVDPTTGTDSLCMLDSFPLPLAPGSQEIAVTEARLLS